MAFPQPVPVSTLPALEGDLAVCPSADLYTLMSALGLSGKLELVRQWNGREEKVALDVRRGRLIAARTSEPRPFLGELLVKHYGVSLEAVIDGLKRQSLARKSGRTPTRLGQILLETRQVSAEILRQALADGVTRLAVPVLAWSEGRFSFWSQPTAPADASDGDPEVALEELIDRGPGPTPL